MIVSHETLRLKHKKSSTLTDMISPRKRNDVDSYSAAEFQLTNWGEIIHEIFLLFSSIQLLETILF